MGKRGYLRPKDNCRVSYTLSGYLVSGEEMFGFPIGWSAVRGPLCPLAPHSACSVDTG